MSKQLGEETLLDHLMRSNSHYNSLDREVIGAFGGDFRVTPLRTRVLLFDPGAVYVFDVVASSTSPTLLRSESFSGVTLAYLSVDGSTAFVGCSAGTSRGSDRATPEGYSPAPVDIFAIDLRSGHVTRVYEEAINFIPVP
jgi:hypothetical protein